MMTKTRTSLVALAIALPLSLAACGSSSTDTTSPAPAAGGNSSTTAPMSETPSTTPTDTASGADAMNAVFGPGCALVPKDGKGSFNGMATAPLGTAVKAAGLVDTLNSAPAITVFAPTNDAFAKIPADTLKKVLADKPTLTKILTNHVIAGKLSPAMLAGTHKTLAGTEITAKGSGENFTVGKADAKVVCGNVQTANATVYIIDSVLMP